MVIKRFWDDPGLTRLDTRVVAVDGDAVRLEQTIFFAESGGQESDSGTIGGRPVREARYDGLDIVYRLDPEHGLAPGDAVVVEIDGERRQRLLRLHFAAELVLELVNRRCAGIVKIGAHIAADKARIDFLWPDSLAAILPAVAHDAAQLIAADHPVVSAFSDPVRERRYWDIDGFARVACGGTHPRRSGEVGALTLVRKNPGRGKERIEIRLLS
jgi:Ser-tRNA(Ala) deacylase AlaX